MFSTGQCNIFQAEKKKKKKKDSYNKKLSKSENVKLHDTIRVSFTREVIKTCDH